MRAPRLRACPAPPSCAWQVCLGPQQAPVFGLHVLRLIGGQVECGAGDLATLAFWWSNLAHTRALLLQCTSTATMPAPVSDSLLPQVRPPVRPPAAPTSPPPQGTVSASFPAPSLPFPSKGSSVRGGRQE